MNHKTKLNFFLYIFFVCFIPSLLWYVVYSIPEPILSPTANNHAFDYIDDRALILAIILNLGLYLYPLHFIFINQHTLKVKPVIFIPSLCFFISLSPTISFLLSNRNQPAISFLLFTLLFVFLIFWIPFLFIYYIKYKSLNFRKTLVDTDSKVSPV